MGRYEKYQEAVREERAFRQEQQRLHEKHEEVEEDTVIIETPHIVKYLLLYLRILGKTVFGVTMILLATAGSLTILYPETRQELLVVLQGIFDNIRNLL